MMRDIKIDIKEYLQFSFILFAVQTVFLWASIFACIFAACYYDSSVGYLIAFLFLGSRQLALSHMIHSASHFHLHRNKWVNDCIGDVFFASPVLISTESYRAQHILHHRHTGISEKDTDERAWYNVKGHRFVLKMLLALCGGEAIKTILSYNNANVRPSKSSAKIRYVTLVIATNLGLLGVFHIAGNIWAYLFLWLLPLLTITPVFIILRVIAEHQPIEYSANGADTPEKSFEPPLTRTINGGLLGRYLLGSFNFCYHHEHHLYPGINYQQLPAVHQKLYAEGYYDEQPEALNGSYFSTLKDLIFPHRGANANL